MSLSKLVINIFILVVIVINFRINFCRGNLYELVNICSMLVYIILMMRLVRNEINNSIVIVGRKWY